MWKFSLETMKMTYRELLQWGEQELETVQLPEGKWDAWLLFSYVFEMERGQYFLVMNQEIQAGMNKSIHEKGISDKGVNDKCKKSLESLEYDRQNKDVCLQENLIEKYQIMIGKRRQRIPLQHITGEQEFMGYTFLVNRHVLIPRQDTECLVEKVWEEIVRRKENKETDQGGEIHVMDMCTGSGCIAVSLCKMYQEWYGQKLDMTAVDVCEQALQVAGENGRRLKCEHIHWTQSDLFAQLTQNDGHNKYGAYDIIVSNPPYIPTKVIDSLEDEVKLYDPWKALDGKEDGFYFYEKIIKQSVSFMRPQGMLAFEIGCEQGAEVKSMMEQAGYRQVEISKDLAGLDRVVKGFL